MVAKHGYEWAVYAVDEVGYKLSKRGERVRVNELCAFVDGSGNEQPNVHRAAAAVHPLVNSGSPVRVLDFLRRDTRWL
jgi:hypothetical protein